jgi:hypothetical protein
VDAYFSGCLTLTFINYYIPRSNNICIVDLPQTVMSVIPKHIHKHVITLSHIITSISNHDIRLQYAQDLLNMYSNARCVITSRLHCALPCLAFGTPVVFIYQNKHDPRFPGLLNLMRHYSLDSFLAGNCTINWDDPGPNPVDIGQLRQTLIRKCKDFIDRELTFSDE